MIWEMFFDLGNYLGNDIWSRKLSRKFYIISEVISEVLYHLGNYLENFKWSQKWSKKIFIISEIISQIIYDIGNFLLGSPFSAFVWYIRIYTKANWVLFD